ncbi:MAG: hypothetical protein EOP50_07915, partial [Sphingobacteriales bacterium]
MKSPQESPFWRKWSNNIPSIRKHPLSLNVLRALPFWVASLLTGLIAVGFTKLFGLCERLLKSELHGHYWIIFLLAPVFFLLAWTVVQWWA